MKRLKEHQHKKCHTRSSRQWNKAHLSKPWQWRKCDRRERRGLESRHKHTSGSWMDFIKKVRSIRKKLRPLTKPTQRLIMTYNVRIRFFVSCCIAIFIRQADKQNTQTAMSMSQWLLHRLLSYTLHTGEFSERKQLRKKVPLIAWMFLLEKTPLPQHTPARLHVHLHTSLTQTAEKPGKINEGRNKEMTDSLWGTGKDPRWHTFKWITRLLALL